MANSKQLFISLAIIAIFVPSISAVEYVVGDEKGWTINFDYQAWAQGKEFHVGDKLECVPPADDTSALTSGNDVITLTTPGRKWYICGVPQHCQVGNQKLLITVIPDIDDVASPTPSSPSPSQDIQPSSANILNSFSTLAFITTLLLILGVLGVFFG
ncbi:hypothetical protein G4B88_014423 [Cannabis sativa]|uniref:Phytocyanin domain-containing protein n=1 Tax=Cannabis sativa TaxID=3483 RepID=A0A7J6I8V5_CANSA|nr:hypothetical protein G4B88_014423 [Cannabis sativa]